MELRIVAVPARGGAKNWGSRRPGVGPNLPSDNQFGVLHLYANFAGIA